MGEISYRQLSIDGHEISYREAGRRDAPPILLLHGFPSAGHMFFDTGHFALETHSAEVAQPISAFLPIVTG